MVRRKQDDGGAAVIERTVNPDDIAARVAAADIEARKAQAVADVTEWRRVVASIADGHEPDGKALAAIGDLTRRLRLPPDAVARSVKALQEERRLQAECDRTKDRIKSVKDREVELAAEIKATEAKLLALREEVAEYVGLHQGYPHQAIAVATVRNENPVLFADAEHVADRLIAADVGMGTEMFKNMVPQVARLEGVSRGSWGG